MRSIVETNVAGENMPSGLASKIEQLLASKPVILQVLKFVAIGVLNTALDFIVYNYITKAFNISAGLKLGQVNVIGFVLAVFQSYFWNKYWAFAGSHQVITLWQNFIRLVLVGLLGGVTFVLVALGASKFASPSYYLVIFLLFIVLEVVLWELFGFSKLKLESQAKGQFVSFILVSLIGLAINIVIVSLVSQKLHLTTNADLNKNIAKVLATVISLMWNFIGYKLVVFKQ